MDFKEGDYVKIEDGTELLGNFIAGGLVGKIIKRDSDFFYIQLDAFSLPKVSHKFLKGSALENWDARELYIEEKLLEPATRRDTDELYAIAKSEFDKCFDGYNVKKVLKKELSLKTKWKKGFLKSRYYESLSETQQTFSGNFLNWYLDALQILKQCSLFYFEEDCHNDIINNFIPVEFDVNQELKNDAAEILKSFILYLHYELAYIHKEDLQEYLECFDFHKTSLGSQEKIADYKLVKSMGVNMHSMKEVRVLLSKIREERWYNETFFNYNKSKKVYTKVAPPKQQSIEGLKPNDRVTVKYDNGLLKQDVKYKQVKEDLEKGLCRLIRR